MKLASRSRDGGVSLYAERRLWSWQAKPNGAVDGYRACSCQRKDAQESNLARRSSRQRPSLGGCGADGLWGRGAEPLGLPSCTIHHGVSCFAQALLMAGTLSVSAADSVLEREIS